MTAIVFPTRATDLHMFSVIPGRVEDATPESRDAGFNASRRPGTTESMS